MKLRTENKYKLQVDDFLLIEKSRSHSDADGSSDDFSQASRCHLTTHLRHHCEQLAGRSQRDTLREVVRERRFAGPKM